ncbi:hypothetical protein AKO1_014378 [Acrasis kona]|uniref:Uncharacterized protein n=1 Tax=Acrasis kona TaxID=1008807 RepID=A0AAW2Z138_9EUKA
MNLPLLDVNEYVGAFPEIIEDQLDLGNYLTGISLQFNSRGTLLAVGCYDGRIVVFDFETRTCCAKLKGKHHTDKKPEKQTIPSGVKDGHTQLVVSMSWFKNGRHLLSAGYDAKLFVWDVLESVPIKCVTFKSALYRAYVCPKDDNLVLVVPTYEVPVLMKMDTEEQISLPITKHDYTQKKKHDYMIANFDKTGDHIYVGNSLGEIVILRTKDLTQVKKFYIDDELEDPNVMSKAIRKNTYAIKQIHFSRQGRYFMVNCGLSIRLFRVEDCGFEVEFKDMVTNSQFITASFSGLTIIPDSDWDSDFVIAASGHCLYIWDRATGSLQKMLEGSKDNLLSMEWHPLRPIVVSTTTGGVAHIWGKNFNEMWSAFAPDFEEIENNEVYLEREDEFDMKEEEEEMENMQISNQENDHIDIHGFNQSLTNLVEFSEFHMYPKVVKDVDDALESYMEAFYSSMKKKTKSSSKKKDNDFIHDYSSEDEYYDDDYGVLPK